MKVLPLEGQPWVKTGREGRSTDHTKLNDETRCDIMKREKHQRASEEDTTNGWRGEGALSPREEGNNIPNFVRICVKLEKPVGLNIQVRPMSEETGFEKRVPAHRSNIVVCDNSTRLF
eukprot:4507548-Pyramimonas_sp.AAC.3